MAYFTKDDHNALLQGLQEEDALQRIHRRMLDLHQKIYNAIKKYQLNLYADPIYVTKPGSICATAADQVMTVLYCRTPPEAANVERIMGHEIPDTDNSFQPRMHPGIELRMSPEYLTIELVVPPQAWHDQQNFVGKLSVDQHRQTLYQILSGYDTDYCLGFWAGTHLDDMHLSTTQLPPPRILFEYLETFAVSRDYLRLGRWYEPEAQELAEDTIKTELFDRIRDLYLFYDFLLWTSNNNFQAFYKKSLSHL